MRMRKAEKAVNYATSTPLIHSSVTTPAHRIPPRIKPKQHDLSPAVVVKEQVLGTSRQAADQPL
jgi:hypothetical protein